MMHNEFILVEKIEESKALQLASKKSWEKVKVLEGKHKGETLIVNAMGLTLYKDNKYFLDERRIYMTEGEAT